MFIMITFLLVTHKWMNYVKEKTNEILPQITEDRSQRRINGTRAAFDDERKALRENWGLIQKDSLRAGNQYGMITLESHLAYVED